MKPTKPDPFVARFGALADLAREVAASGEDGIDEDSDLAEDLAALDLEDQIALLLGDALEDEDAE